MKRIFFLSLLILGIFPFPTIQAKENPDHQKKWTEGRLSWSDFQASGQAKGVSSQMRAWIGISNTKEQKGNIALLRPTSYAYIDRSLSWVDPNAKSDRLLRYHQASFDLLELYRRKFQRELDKSISQTEADGFHRHFMKAYDDQLAVMRLETAEGTNEEKMREWELYIRKELNAEAEAIDIRYSPMAFGYGLNIGAGYISPTGTLADAFSPTAQFVIGLDFSYRKWHLYTEAGISQVKNRADILVSGKGTTALWKKNGHTDFSMIHVDAGYDFIDNSKFRLAPFVGIAVTDYSRVKKESGKDKVNMHILDVNASFGLCFDYKFATIASISPSFWLGHREMITSAIRTKVFVGMARYDSFAKGALIGVSLSYSCSGRMIRVR